MSMHSAAALIGTSALATKEFTINNQGNQNTPWVRIVGRPAGIIDFLMTLVGIDTTTVFEVYSDRIVYQRSSLSGSMKTQYPLTAIAGTTAGFFKPAIYLALALITAPTFILPIVFVLLYFFNKALLVGVEANSGSFSAIAFKSSVIEGRKVDRNDAEAVTAIINRLVLQARLPG